MFIAIVTNVIYMSLEMYEIRRYRVYTLTRHSMQWQKEIRQIISAPANVFF